jgi:hypothetical protein
VRLFIERAADAFHTDPGANRIDRTVAAASSSADRFHSEHGVRAAHSFLGFVSVMIIGLMRDEE